MDAVRARSFLSNDFNSKKSQTLAALCMGFFMICIGIPIWWKTTVVYRAPLPFDEISALNMDNAVDIKVRIEVECDKNDDGCSKILEDFTGKLRSQLSQTNANPKNHVTFTYEIFELGGLKGLEKGNVIKVRLLIDPTKPGGIVVSNKGIITCFFHNANKIDINAGYVADTIKFKLVNERLVEQMAENIYRSDQKERHNIDLIKMVQTNPKFELLFSLINPEPDVQLATWDMESFTREYLDPMLEKLKPVYNFHVGSQILYFTKIPYRPKLQQGADNNVLYRYLTSQQLSLAINPIEGRLGSQVSTDPTLNFVVYVTEKKFNPLFIKKDDGQLSKTNAFLVPRWGSMQLYNLGNNTKPKEVTQIDPDKMMLPFVAHLRVLLGLHNIEQLNSQVVLELPSQDGIADWELNYLMRLRTVENIATATHTLNSLSQLLNEISNIVINDNIATEVYAAVKSVVSAKKHLASGNLLTALSDSKKAFKSSETAFFDPTLLELLYFPEDQKFAIYIPLFLPISLPILVSLIQAIKRIRKGDFDKEKDKSD